MTFSNQEVMAAFRQAVGTHYALLSGCQCGICIVRDDRVIAQISEEVGFAVWQHVRAEEIEVIHRFFGALGRPCKTDRWSRTPKPCACFPSLYPCDTWDALALLGAEMVCGSGYAAIIKPKREAHGSSPPGMTILVASTDWEGSKQDTHVASFRFEPCSVYFAFGHDVRPQDLQVLRPIVQHLRWLAAQMFFATREDPKTGRDGLGECHSGCRHCNSIGQCGLLQGEAGMVINRPGRLCDPWVKRLHGRLENGA
jgi:hypothetical protein